MTILRMAHLSIPTLSYKEAGVALFP
jgi:hypothetical protein